MNGWKGERQRKVRTAYSNPGADVDGLGFFGVHHRQGGRWRLDIFTKAQDSTESV